MKNIKIIRGQWFTIVFVIFLLFPNIAWTDCSCQIGSNGMENIGLEYIATTCPSDPPSDDTVYAYKDIGIKCNANRITESIPPGDVIIASPKTLIPRLKTFGYNIGVVIRNPAGTHIIAVLETRYPFNGVVSGVSIAGTPAGVYTTTPAENFNEYCTAWPLTDQDGDHFPDCLDCAPGDPTKNAECPAPEKNFGPQICF